MDDQTYNHLLHLLRQALDALRTHNPLRLRDLSEQTVHSSTIFQDEINISIAVILYSLFKIYEKNAARQTSDWNRFTKTVEEQLYGASLSLHHHNIPRFQRDLRTLQEHIKSYEANFGLYVREVLDQAKVQKGSKVVEHGISAGRAAELLGISKWELQDYIGFTKLPDLEPSRPVKQRIIHMRQLFP